MWVQIPLPASCTGKMSALPGGCGAKPCLGTGDGGRRPRMTFESRQRDPPSGSEALPEPLPLHNPRSVPLCVDTPPSQVIQLVIDPSGGRTPIPGPHFWGRPRLAGYFEDRGIAGVRDNASCCSASRCVRTTPFSLCLSFCPALPKNREFRHRERESFWPRSSVVPSAALAVARTRSPSRISGAAPGPPALEPGGGGLRTSAASLRCGPLGRVSLRSASGPRQGASSLDPHILAIRAFL